MEIQHRAGNMHRIALYGSEDPMNPPHAVDAPSVLLAS